MAQGHFSPNVRSDVPFGTFGNILVEFLGLPTILDQQRGEWEILCDPKELCYLGITISSIVIRHHDGKFLQEINLSANSQYKKHTPDSFLLHESNQCYGFRLSNPKDALKFDQTLKETLEHLRYQASQPHPSSHYDGLHKIQYGIPRRSPPPVFPLVQPIYETIDNFRQDNGVNQTNVTRRNSTPNEGYKEAVNSFSYMNQLSNDVNQPSNEACQSLSDEIAVGNIKKAQEIVEQLAKKQLKVNVQFQEDGVARDFNVIIKVADKHEERVCFPLRVDPQNTTIGMLKHQILHKYQFPVSVQRWIISDRLAKDNDTLYKCGVNTTGTTIYLYLVSYEDADVKNQLTQTETEFSSPTMRTQSSSQFHNINAFHVQQDLQPINYPPNAHIVLPRVYKNGTIVRPKDARYKEGWECPSCTYKNLPTFPGCKMCSVDRPAAYKIPVDYRPLPEEIQRIEKERLFDEMTKQAEKKRRHDDFQLAMLNYEKTVNFAQLKLIPNPGDFDCPICYTNFAKGEAVMLRECLHCFCKICLAETIKASEDPEVRCPYNDGFPCPAVITGQEIEELLGEKEFNKFLDRSLATAEHQVANSFHCRTPNCKGWCEYEDDVNYFDCPICVQRNCLTCKAIHANVTCKEYQDELKLRAENDDAAKKTQQMLEELVNRGEAMKCPKCAIILQKKSGCDWMKCTMCLTEICWATKGPRWGPNGKGDTSGGCKCKVDGQRCTPTCGNCH